ncbi:hypothetical protein [Gluconobacter roseus]|uniref:Uncharacterized protein n=1 Tax=Gluconobacter roseus NBRC 3990 TaxID=1307950 RepID=A0A4Y3M8U4_9PROT|nr:hypothetical protein [Gluconobacter roseus]GEB04925.1 hypothetical protein GRO01_25010 [Gluconobacter roseus NBRC 3990]GLP94529.1 hypothetical protein GCM10007871_25070 [Gluconobacter roseus NBRC 3990]
MTLTLLDDVKLDGFPVEQLYPGWAPVSRTPVVDDFSVVVFGEDSSGRQACWWLEGENYSASHVLALHEPVRRRLLTAMDYVFWPLATGVLGGPYLISRLCRAKLCRKSPSTNCRVPG